ncbi:MAG TPA: hypothetical protein VG406_22460 [Isosphaeraceae bacterium]|jgi:hypothetical protein|nr:hypothetical protein [Isosphaeraceae bacterium]
MRTQSRTLGPSIALASGLLFAAVAVADDTDKSRDRARDLDTPQTPVEVHEWSVWVGSPTQGAVNAIRSYPNAMPGAVGTSRPKAEDKDPNRRFPVAPISVLQFFGTACKDVDVDIRAKKGNFVAHWPPSNERGGRLQWFKSDLVAEVPDSIPIGYLPPSHWFQDMRSNKEALYLKNGAKVERFVAYDTELNIPIPVRLRGGPDEYTLQNLTDGRLIDVAVIVPSEKGVRVGWLDELPTAVPEDKDKKKKDKDKEKPKPAADAGKATPEKAEAVFRDAEEKPKDKGKEEKLPPVPPEGDPTVRARVDQVLNRPVNVSVEKTARREVLALIARQVRVAFEIDDKGLAKGEVDLNKPMDLKAEGVAARDALADVLGEAGLSYRVTQEGRLYITTAARLAESESKGQVVEGPPVKLLMSQPVKVSDSSYKEMTRDVLARRLAGQGLREDVIKTLLDEYGKALFEQGELVVLVHLSRDAIDEAVLLDVFPPPKKVVRTALILVHGIDPRLQDRARALVKQLGDNSPKTRDAAESKLFELGPVAVPALEDALVEKDVEIVFRAERLLLRLNRSVP